MLQESALFIFPWGDTGGEGKSSGFVFVHTTAVEPGILEIKTTTTTTTGGLQGGAVQWSRKDQKALEIWQVPRNKEEGEAGKSITLELPPLEYRRGMNPALVFAEVGSWCKETSTPGVGIQCIRAGSPQFQSWGQACCLWVRYLGLTSEGLL